MKYFILFASVATITKRVSFFIFPQQPLLRRQIPTISPVPQCLWLPRMAGWWVTMTGPHSQSFSTLWLHGLARSHEKYNHYIFTTVVPMATKFGRTVTYLGGLPPIKLLDPSVTWSCKITWQTKIIISALPQCLWSPNLASWWLTLRGFQADSHMTF